MKKISNQKEIIIERLYIDGKLQSEKETKKFVYEQNGKFVSRWEDSFKEVVKQPDGTFLMEIKSAHFKLLSFSDVKKNWKVK